MKEAKKDQNPSKVFKRIVEGVRTFLRVKGTPSIKKIELKTADDNPFDGIPLPRKTL